MSKPRMPVCVFLIPLVRDSDRRPHPPILWRQLQDALLAAFGGVTGPESVVLYRNADSVPGRWDPGEGEVAVEDESRKYTVAIPEEKVDQLRALLKRAGNSFDQRAMYLEVAGHAEILDVGPADGFLEDASSSDLGDSGETT